VLESLAHHVNHLRYCQEDVINFLIMDFIDWYHHVLQTLEDERFNPHLSDHTLQNLLFGEMLCRRERSEQQ
jgi:hypothetical protein